MTFFDTHAYTRQHSRGRLRDKSKLRSFVHNVEEGEELSRKHAGAHDPALDSARWQRRHRITQVKICGEVESADLEAAESFPPQLKSYMNDNQLTPEQVYNCDETAIFWRILHSKTIALQNYAQKTQGYKIIKDRITLRKLYCYWTIASLIHLLLNCEHKTARLLCFTCQKTQLY